MSWAISWTRLDQFTLNLISGYHACNMDIMYMQYLCWTSVHLSVCVCVQQDMYLRDPWTNSFQRLPSNRFMNGIKLAYWWQFYCKKPTNGDCAMHDLLIIPNCYCIHFYTFKKQCNCYTTAIFTIMNAILPFIPYCTKSTCWLTMVLKLRGYRRKAGVNV